MAVARAVNVMIVLNGQEYSIVEIPCESSAVVIRQKEALLKLVDMKVFLH